MMDNVTFFLSFFLSFSKQICLLSPFFIIKIERDLTPQETPFSIHQQLVNSGEGEPKFILLDTRPQVFLFFSLSFFFLFFFFFRDINKMTIKSITIKGNPTKQWSEIKKT